MKNLKNFVSRVVWVLVACAIISACSDKDDLINNVEEGLPASISFELTTPAPNQVTTRATDAQETNVEKLALFFYKTETSTPIVYEVPQKDLATHTGAGTNYTYNITVPVEVGLTTGSWYLYAVANWDKGFWDGSITLDQLKGMSKTQMDNFCITKEFTTIDITESAILLTGKYGDTENGLVNLQRQNPQDPNSTTCILAKPIHLKRSIAKILFHFKGGEGVTFVPQKLDIYNYCRTATFFEREGWTKVADPGNLTWKGNGTIDTNSNFDKGLDYAVEAEKDPERLKLGFTHAFTFYAPENVQKAKKTEGLTQALREKRSKNVDHTNKEGFEFASDKTTYVVVHGTYAGPGRKKDENNQPITENVTANVSYTIMLGDFSESGSVDNFSIRRNTKYHYNVTINGVNNIAVEAQTDTDEKQPGAEGDVIKRNPDDVKLLDSHYETTMLKFPSEMVNKGSSETLQLGLILKTPFVDIISESMPTDLAERDIDWVHFCKPASTKAFVSPEAATKAGMLNLVELVQHLSDGTHADYCVTGTENGVEYLYFQAFVDEFFYENTNLDRFINAPNRVMTLAKNVYVSADKQSTFTKTPMFSIEQRSIKSGYNMNAQNPFGMETTEDQPKDYLNKLPPTDDGGEDGHGSDKQNGYTNTTANIVMGVAGTETGDLWATYIDPATNKLVEEYDYAHYHFLTRNRDLDGNGYINEDEIKWYLPAVNQHIAIWNFYFALPAESRLQTSRTEDITYFTSTNQGYRTLWANEGAFGTYKKADMGGLNLTRCIRSLKSLNGETTKSSDFDPKTRIMHVHNLGIDAVRPAGSQKGEYLFHPQFDVNNKLPSTFQVANKVISEFVVTPAEPENPGDKHVPVLAEFVQKDHSSIDLTNSKNKILEATFTITNFGDGKKYFWNDKNVLNGATQIKENGNITLKIEGVKASKTYYKYILSENGNYVEIKFEVIKPAQKDYRITVLTPKIIQANQPSGGTPAVIKPIDCTTIKEDVCKYFDNGDPSTRGQWRVPNQRELMVMLLHNVPELQEGVLTRTYFDRERDGKPTQNPFVIEIAEKYQVKFLTSDHSQISSYYVLPVRDVVDATTPTSYSDSSFEPGYSLIE